MTDKKLLVLDVNGLLIDTYFHKEPLPEESPDARVGNFYVYKRPFCDEFLQFCLDNFIVGIWSSAREYNVNNLVDYVFGDAKERLAFSWHQSDCTDVGLKAPDNQWKPLFMKELSKLWRKVKKDLPWSEGDYGPTNTLLVDDTPYKAVLNPPNTAIFPRSYTARDYGDTFLGRALRSYLEGVRAAASVQMYVENNPFGEPSITPESPLWSHISKVLLRVQSVLNKNTDEIAQVLPVEAVSDDNSGGGRRKRPRFRKWKGYSDPLPLTDDIRPFVDLPSEAIELQSSENAVQSEEYCDSTIVEGISGKEFVVLSGPLQADVQSKDEQPLLASSHMDSGRNDGDNRMMREASLSCQENSQGTVLGADKTTLEEHACIAEQTFYDSKQAHLNASARIDGLLDDIQEQGGDEVDDQRKEENGQMVCGNSSFNALESKMMQLEDNNEQCCKNKESITPCDDHLGTFDNWGVLDDSLPCSDRGWVKHGRFHGQSNKSHGKRDYSYRDHSDFNHTSKRQKGPYRDNKGSDYNQTWKGQKGFCRDNNRQKGFCRDNNRHASGFTDPWRGRKVWYEGHNRDNIGYGPNWTRQRHGGATNMLPFSGREQRRLQNDNPRYEADRGHANRHSSFSSYVRPSQQMPVDVPTDYTFGESRVSSSRKAVIDKDFSSEPYQGSGGVHVTTTSSNVYGCTQDGAPLSDQWYHGLEPKTVYEGSSVWPETTEDRSMKSWHIDWANREAGASSEPYRKIRPSSWSYRRSSGASKVPHKGAGASMQQHHSYSHRRKRW